VMCVYGLDSTGSEYSKAVGSRLGVMNTGVLKKTRIFLTSCATISFSRKALLNGGFKILYGKLYIGHNVPSYHTQF
jgi:hypothetical protein